jgi:hypothetical protein
LFTQQVNDELTNDRGMSDMTKYSWYRTTADTYTLPLERREDGGIVYVTCDIYRNGDGAWYGQIGFDHRPDMKNMYRDRVGSSVDVPAEKLLRIVKERCERIADAVILNPDLLRTISAEETRAIEAAKATRTNAFLSLGDLA